MIFKLTVMKQYWSLDFFNKDEKERKFILYFGVRSIIGYNPEVILLLHKCFLDIYIKEIEYKLEKVCDANEIDNCLTECLLFDDNKGTFFII